MKRIIIISMSIMLVVLAFGQTDFNANNGVKLDAGRLSPRLLSYQGFLTDTLGNPITNPSVSMIFGIWSSSSGGSQIWFESQIVSVNKGIFSVLLGGISPIPDTIFTKGTDRWLELTYSGITLSPRTRIVSTPYAYTSTLADTAANARLLQGKDTTALDARYVNEGQVNSIFTPMIIDTAVTMTKIARAGAATNQVIKWNGAAWTPANDLSSADNHWTYLVSDVADTTLQMGGRWGIARLGNVLFGNADSTHVNFGVACTTGASGQNYKYSTVSGGYINTASNAYATVGGGYDNTASANYSTIAGGRLNNASTGYASIGGGYNNTVSNGSGTTVSGGYDNTASGSYATVGGGYADTASGYAAVVGGGYLNNASGSYAALTGGRENSVSGTYSSIGGGYINNVTSSYAAVGGGYRNIGSGNFAFVGGGNADTAKAAYGFIGSGYINLAGDSLIDTAAVVAGGSNNTATSKYSFVGGGHSNDAETTYAAVVGGTGNTASGYISFIGGGQANTASGYEATVAGGRSHDASGSYATIGGGYNNTASDEYPFVGGGWQNIANGYLASVVGGHFNSASDTGTTVGGGCYNKARGLYSVVSGGGGATSADSNAASGNYSVVGGGRHNNTNGRYAAVIGGYNNSANSDYATVCGGGENYANGYEPTVGGGYGNTADGDEATVAGGYSNTVSSYGSTVGGGWTNIVSSSYSTISGGMSNTASSSYTTIAGGYQNIANGTFAAVAGGRYCTAAAYSGFAANYSTKVDSSDTNSAAFTTSHTTAKNQVRAAAFSTGTLDFAMDHPDDPMNKILNQYGVGSNEMMLIYRGSIVMDASGRASVNLPDYFDDINQNPMVQLTGVGSSEVVYVAEDVKGNSFVIGGKPGMKVYWTVTAERKDIHAEIARIQTPVVQEKKGCLRGHSIDDDAMIGMYDGLHQKNPDLFKFRTDEGRSVHEQLKRMIEEGEKK